MLITDIGVFNIAVLRSRSISSDIAPAYLILSRIKLSIFLLVMFWILSMPA